MQNNFKSVPSLIMLFVLGLCTTLFTQGVDFQALETYCFDAAGRVSGFTLDLAGDVEFTRVEN
jgi:hypothetical protein